VLVEGDKDQARLAWKVLGGGDTSISDDIFAKQMMERYSTKFIDPPPTTTTGTTATTKNPYGYEYQGQTLTGVIVDRVFEMESRLNEKIPQEQQTAGGNNNTNKNIGQRINNDEGGDFTAFKYETSKGATVELTVVERTIEAPSENGFGFNELIRITTAAGGLMPGNVIRAVRVKRRFRRAFDKDGNRVVEGLEIVKTFRVLDGVAGEIPTSTTKSQIQFLRPASTSS